MSSSSGIIKIKGIVNSFGEKQRRKLNVQWRKDIEDSNSIISEIEANPKYVEENIDSILAMIERLNNELDYYTQLGVDIEEKETSSYNFSEIRRNLERNYRTLSLIYYRYNFDQNKIKYDESKQRLKQITEAQNKIERKMNSTDNRVEGLGATFLNMVLTISIVPTMVTVLLKAEPEHAILIVLICAWLLLSSIIFISTYFKKESEETENLKFAKKVYTILSIVTLIAVIIFMYTNIDKSDKRIDEYDKRNQNEIANNS